MSIESKIKKNILLAPLTTFKIGGPAEYFIEIKTKDELVKAIGWTKENKKEFIILAGGSNVLINDKGISGLVIKISNKDIAARGERMDCGAGVDLVRVGRLAANNSLSGLEWAVGIPGATVGGSTRGNAGAFGFAMQDLVETVEIFNIKKEKFVLFSNKDCKFVYRESIFKKDNSLLIWQVILKLNKGYKKEIDELMDKNLKQREQTQPKLPSAGSAFKNLNITNLREFNANLASMAEEEKIVKSGKVGAGWVINLLGLKGKTIGGAKVSLEHANFIVNTGKATAEDVAMLISFIKQQIRNRLKIQLHEEIQYLGF